VAACAGRDRRLQASIFSLGKRGKGRYFNGIASRRRVKVEPLRGAFGNLDPPPTRVALKACR
jgi:hypothetical protein